MTPRSQNTHVIFFEKHEFYRIILQSYLQNIIILTGKIYIVILRR